MFWACCSVVKQRPFLFLRSLWIAMPWKSFTFLFFLPNFSLLWLPISLVSISLTLLLRKEGPVAMFPIIQANRIWKDQRGPGEVLPAPWLQELPSQGPHHLISMAFAPECFFPYTFGWSSLSILFLFLSPPPTFVTLGKRAKGNLWFHKSGVEYLLCVMNRTLMSLIKAILAIYHMSLVHQGERSWLH